MSAGLDLALYFQRLMARHSGPVYRTDSGWLAGGFNRLDSTRRIAGETPGSDLPYASVEPRDAAAQHFDVFPDLGRFRRFPRLVVRVAAEGVRLLPRFRRARFRPRHHAEVLLEIPQRRCEVFHV